MATLDYQRVYFTKIKTTTINGVFIVFLGEFAVVVDKNLDETLFGDDGFGLGHRWVQTFLSDSLEGTSGYLWHSDLYRFYYIDFYRMAPP